mgnify:CR=1 FL=1
MMSNIGRIFMVIPARGGSKRLPRKNVLNLAGKPLVCWTIEAAISTNLNAAIIVTSDDDEILEIAEKYSSQGVSAYKRPDFLASDTASTVDVVIDVIKREQACEADTIVLLQPTSPLRTADHINSALNLFQEGGNIDAVVGVCQVEHPTSWVGYIEVPPYLEGIDVSGRRSQEYKPEYRLNGAIYIAKVGEIVKNNSLFTSRLRAFIMPDHCSVDIDREIDFNICEALLNKVQEDAC